MRIGLTATWIFTAVAAGGPAVAPPAPADELSQLLQLTRATLSLVQRDGTDVRAFRSPLDALERRAEDARGAKADVRKAVGDELRQLRRRLILSHPALDFDRLLINKRSSAIPGHMCDQYLGRHSQPGPGLCVIESWKTQPVCKPILEGKLPAGSTLNPDLSFDARRVLFSFCASRSDSRDLMGYNVWECSLDGRELRQITGTARDAREGEGGRKTTLIEDFDPCYLPDGGFAFISTRSQQFGRCHGSRYVPSYVLYRAQLDGSNIRRLSYNEANEWDPQVLHDGRIIYCRWDYINRHDVLFQSLWVIHPDGTGTAHYYGNNSPKPCMITEARAIPGSNKVVATGTDHHGMTSGTILIVDPNKGEDHGAPLTAVTPEFPCPEGGLPPETTMTPMPLAESSVGPVAGRGRGGNRAACPYPITEDLFLCAYPHGGQLSIYLIDTLGGRELIYHDPQMSSWTPIPIKPIPTPPVVPSLITGKEHQKTGRFVIQDVHLSRQPIAPGSIKAVRVNQIFPQPTRSKPALSAVSNEVLKRPLGTATVEPDGSVGMEVPANTPLQLQLLDSNGMAVMTMRSLAYVQPGETLSCVGCHESRLDTPPYLARPTVPKIQRLVPPPGLDYPGALSFVRTVQPVLDRYCVDCHGLGKSTSTLNLLGDFGHPASAPQPAKPGQPAVSRRQAFTASYQSLLGRQGLIRIAQRNSESFPSRPMDYYSHAGRLGKFLVDGHKDAAGKPMVQLDAQSLQRIIMWLDVNAQFYGDYSFNRVENSAPSPEGEKALREAMQKRFGPEIARQPFAALVNIAMPSESRILMAPLPVSAGGWGQLTKNAYAGNDDPAYQQMARLVRATIVPPPYHDIDGTCGRDQGCVCGGCWVRLVGGNAHLPPDAAQRALAAKPATRPATQPQPAPVARPAPAVPVKPPAPAKSAPPPFPEL